jgi:hypothetical protein
VQSVHKATSKPSVSRLSRKCGILNISQPCRLPWPLTGLALIYLLMVLDITPFFLDFSLIQSFLLVDGSCSVTLLYEKEPILSSLLQGLKWFLVFIR